MKPLSLALGVKADPIEYRYSYEWLFRLMSQEGVPFLQLGSFFEVYQLPDEWFIRLRRQADEFGIQITSLFTTHRELGGFFQDDPAWVAVARRNFERYIEVGALLGAAAVGHNPGAVLRDQMGTKPQGWATYLHHMQELMAFAHARGVPFLTIEPMSCQAEPPTLPAEIRDMGESLRQFHQAHPATSQALYCADVAHGFADRDGIVRFDNYALLEPCLPHLYELHLKNTDARFDSTFGFTTADRQRGIVDAAAVRDFLLQRADQLPVDHLIGYLEIGGPKLGRDYSDHLLEDQLRQSLRYLKESFLGETAAPPLFSPSAPAPRPVPLHVKPVVELAPSLMCCDLCNLEESVRRLEDVRMDYLHIDIMDSHFTPNLPLGLEVLRQLRRKTALPFDLHLMVNDPLFFIEKTKDLPVQMISVHAESTLHLDRALATCHDAGIRTGVALNPATPLAVLEYVLDRIDFVLIMTVNPGFAGQAMVASGFRKLADCRRFLDERGRADIAIQVDGNVSFANIPRMVAAGARNLVAGTSSIYHRDASLTENRRKMVLAIEEGLQGKEQTHERKEHGRTRAA
jgi:ribulose-phosphate 3-epimerase